MAKTVWTQIMDETFARLGNISPRRGYKTKVRNLERMRFTPFESNDLPAISFWKINDNSSDKRYANRGRELRIGIEMYDLSNENDFDFDLLSDNFMSDIMISLYRSTDAPLVTDDPQPMFEDKSFIMNFELMQPIISTGGAPHYGVFVIVSFNYRVNNLDPFTLI